MDKPTEEQQRYIRRFWKLVAKAVLGDLSWVIIRKSGR